MQNLQDGSGKKPQENLDFAIKDMQQKNVIPRLRKTWSVGI